MESKLRKERGRTNRRGESGRNGGPLGLRKGFVCVCVCNILTCEIRICSVMQLWKCLASSFVNL